MTHVGPEANCNVLALFIFTVTTGSVAPTVQQRQGSAAERHFAVGSAATLNIAPGATSRLICLSRQDYKP